LDDIADGMQALFAVAAAAATGPATGARKRAGAGRVRDGRLASRARDGGERGERETEKKRDEGARDLQLLRDTETRNYAAAGGLGRAALTNVKRFSAARDGASSSRTPATLPRLPADVRRRALVFSCLRRRPGTPGTLPSAKRSLLIGIS